MQGDACAEPPSMSGAAGQASSVPVGIFDDTNPVEGSGSTHREGLMLYHSNHIKQGFRLAQTISLYVSCDTA